MISPLRRSADSPQQGAFEPARQVNLFDDYGIRHSVYVSRSCHYLRIDSNYFKLKRSATNHLHHLLSSIDY